MAVFASVFVPSGEPAVTATLAGASSAEIVLGTNRIFKISATGASNVLAIKFGNAGMGAAAATDYVLPPNTESFFDTGDAYSSIRIFGTGTYSIQKLSRS